MKKLDTKSIITLITDAIIIIGTFLFLIFAAEIMEALPECPFAGMGVQCGSCGGTRCVYNFFQGNFLTAFKFNPYFFFVTLYVLVLLLFLNLSWLFKVKKTDKILAVIADYRTIITIAGFYLIFSVARIVIALN